MLPVTDPSRSRPERRILAAIALAPVVRLVAMALPTFAIAIALLPGVASAAPHAVVVSIDGLRPDVALRADMPALRSLMARGSFTLYAATTDTAVTLPSHASMLSGVAPAKHGILYNGDPKPGDPPHPVCETVFELAHRAGMTSALCAGKSKFSIFVTPEAPEYVSLPPRERTMGDSLVAAAAARAIEAHRPAFVFVHLPGPDLAGHASGWGSRAQLEAAAGADRALGVVLVAIARAGLVDSTLVIVTSDHGGAGRTHGGLDPRSRFIPWVCSGPSVKRDFDLTLVPTLQVRTEDTFATVASWLGLRSRAELDGRAIREAFDTTSASR